MTKFGAPAHEVREQLKKITPDLKRLLELVEETDDDDDHSVAGESLRTGARNLPIAKRILKDSHA